MENNREDIFDSSKRSIGHICCLCECAVNVHICFFKCPIFEKELICSDCCLIEVLRSNIEKKFSEKLGRHITREEINTYCKDCGRNHAIEDSALADKIDWNSQNEEDSIKESHHEEEI